MTGSGLTPAPGDAAPDDVQALAKDIERTREELGETVAALADKADIMARVRQKAGEVTGRLSATARKVKEQIAVPRQRRMIIAAAVGVTVLAGVLLARQRSR